MEDEVFCPVCSGPAILLGVLGGLMWWRCRNCGAQFSTPVEKRN